jgi:hypothetical protein
MKYEFSKATAISLVMLATCAAANSQQMPEKYKNAPPEVRAAAGYPVEREPPPMDVAVLRAYAGRDPGGCASVQTSMPVAYRGRRLVEIPDIAEPDLRLANELMSARCFVRALERLDAVVRADRNNRNANYIVARMTWILVGEEAGEREINRTLDSYPDFVSAKVLLAGLRNAQERLDEVERLIDEAERRAPDDLWIYLNRLRLEMSRNPSRDARARALEITRSAEFPPNAREEAAEIAKGLPNATPHEYEETLRAQLEIDASLRMGCRAFDLAVWLSESQRRFDDVVELLESKRSQDSGCLGTEQNRTLLAQAYLMQAARIGSGPNAQNRHLLERAAAILRGDFSGVGAHVIGRPQAATLQPFIAAVVGPEEKDRYGRTRLCTAVMHLVVDVARAELARGADPNGACGRGLLVEYVVHMATREKVAERQGVLRALLESGAKPSPVLVDVCARSSVDDCRIVLLPIFEKYGR